MLVIAGVGAAPAVAAEPSCTAFQSPHGPVAYDPFFLFFDLGSSAITPEADVVIATAADAYRTLPHCRLLVTAHADRSGSAESNLVLSRRRADAVVAALRRRGVQAAASVEALGETRALVPTLDGVIERQNRRVEFVIGPAR